MLVIILTNLQRLKYLVTHGGVVVTVTAEVATNRVSPAFYSSLSRLPCALGKAILNTKLKTRSLQTVFVPFTTFEISCFNKCLRVLCITVCFASERQRYKEIDR